MTTQKFLIVLTGSEDIDVRLVNAAAEEWLGLDGHPTKSGWRETIPPAVMEGFRGRKTAEITIGSFENDRALQCPGEHFDSIVALVKHCRDHDIELIGEFIGFIY